MENRIKELRTILNLTQQEFADRLGIKRNAISNYEIGRNKPTESVIMLICNTWHVSKEWLLTGKGEMFVALTPNQEIIDFLGSLTTNTPDNDFKKRLIVALSKLSPDEWAVIEQLHNSINI